MSKNKPLGERQIGAKSGHGDAERYHHDETDRLSCEAHGRNLRL